MLEVGDKFGSYDVVRLIGQGGMGYVYLLKGSDGRFFVAKILNPQTADDHESRVRFLQEAEIAQKIRSPSLVETYDIGEDPDTGLCYILMEYIGGGSLHSLLAERGKLSVKEALEYTRLIALTLEVVRQHDIVHRDIKPDNIMFTESGQIKLMDLGIARSSAMQSTTLTKTGMLMGTPAYMSPEQMLNPHDVDIRSDIYSLGIVLFEMLIGARPYHNATFMELMAKTVQGDKLPDIRSYDKTIPKNVAALVAKMCDPKRERRYSTPGELAADIEAIQRGKKSENRLAKFAPYKNFIIYFAAFVAVIGLCVTMIMLNLKKAKENEEAKEIEKPAPRELKPVESPSPKAEPPDYVAKNGEKVYAASVGGFKWFYVLNDRGEAVLHRPSPENDDQLTAVEPNPTGKVVVPSHLNGHPVVRLERDCLHHLNAEVIELPNTLRDIGMGVFASCGNLKRVSFPDSVERVEAYLLFGHCHKLEEINLNRANGFRSTSLWMFEGWNVRDIKINERYSDLKYVGDFLISQEGGKLHFCRDFNTREIVVPQGVKSLEPLSMCGHKAKKFVVPKSVVHINPNVFYAFKPEKIVFKCDMPPKLSDQVFCILSPTHTKIFVEQDTKGWPSEIGGHKIERIFPQPNEQPEYVAKTGEKVYVAKVGDYKWFYVVNEIGEAVLHRPSADTDDRLTAVEPNPTGRIAIPTYLNGRPLVRLERDCLHHLNAKLIELPDTLREIGMGVFSGNTELMTIRFPDSVEKIDSYWLFRFCSKMKSIHLGNAKGFSSIALPGCAVKEITVGEKNPELMKKGQFIVSRDGKRLVWYNRPDENGEVVVVPDGIEVLSSFAFKAQKVNRVVLPKSLKEAESWSLQCEVDKLEFPEGFRKLSGPVFYGSKIKTLVLPASLESVDNNSFSTQGKDKMIVFFKGDKPKHMSPEAVHAGGKRSFYVRESAKGWRELNAYPNVDLIFLDDAEFTRALIDGPLLGIDKYQLLMPQGEHAECENIIKLGTKIFGSAKRLLALKSTDSIANFSKVRKIEFVPNSNRIAYFKRAKMIKFGLKANDEDVVNALVNLVMLYVDDGVSDQNQPIIDFFKEELLKSIGQKRNELSDGLDINLLRTLKALDSGLFRKYFQKRREFVRTGQLSNKMSKEDYVAVLSHAIAQDLFSYFGNGYRRESSGIKCDKLPQFSIFN